MVSKIFLPDFYLNGKMGYTKTLGIKILRKVGSFTYYLILKIYLNGSQIVSPVVSEKCKTLKMD